MINAQKRNVVFLSVIVYYIPEICAPLQPVFSQNATESTDLCKQKTERKKDEWWYVLLHHLEDLLWEVYRLGLKRDDKEMIDVFF